MSFRESAERLDAFFESRTRRAVLLAVSVGLLLTLLKVFADNWLSAYIVGPAIAGTSKMANLPMGFGGLLVIGALLAAIVLSFIDTSPTVNRLAAYLAVRQDRPKPHVPTAIEQNEIEAARQAWSTDADDACSSLSRLLTRAIEFFGNKGDPFVSLLHPIISELQEATKRTQEELHAEVPSLSTLQDALTRLHGAYSRCACWLNRCCYLDPTFPGEPEDYYASGLVEWRRVHPELAGVFIQLAKRSSYAKGIPSGIPTDSLDLQFQLELIYRERLKYAASRQAVEELRLLTEDAEKFLQLFTLLENPMHPDDSQSWLPAEVWKAGQRLVDRGILKSVERTQGIVRFTIPETTKAAWGIGKIDGEIVRDFVDIDLHSVRSSMGSGGGAR